MAKRKTSPIAIAAIAIFLIVLPACRKKHRTARLPGAPQPSTASTRPPVKKSAPLPVGYTEQGVASWYGIPYHGRPAANGEIYDMETLVAAHRVMPFNTWLKVTNLSNNKSVDVRVIDRGPFVDGRIIDLSKAAARQIDLLGPGIGEVRLEVISAPADIPSNDFYAVQVGAFSIYGNAERLRSEYAQRFGTAQLAVKQGAVPLWRVLVGKEPSLQTAQQLASVLTAEGKNVFVVRLDQTIPSPPPASTAGANGTPLPGIPPPNTSKE
jgi:rare lipoprotein A